MKLKVFAVRDDKALVFNAPFFMSQKGQAVRMFGDLAEDAKSSVYKHPADYALYLLGEFDDESGKLISLNTPEYLSRGSDFSANKVGSSTDEER